VTFINTCADVDDLGGGRFRHTQHIKPVAYDDNGTLRAIGSAFTTSGIADRPHAVRAAQLMTSVADDGMRRIHPTREKDRYVEIGAPYVKVGGVWRKMGFRGGMRAANRLTWVSPQANMSIAHAGHYIKLEIELKRGYVPEDNLIAFPVGLNGLKRSGANILSDGKTVMHLREPQMYDAANEMDTRAIDGKFVSLAGQPYYLMTLPDLTGMSRPVIDPTLALQPDAAAGADTSLLGGSDATKNTGVRPHTFAIRTANNGLIRWNLSTIPSSAICVSATLTLTTYWAVWGNFTMRVYLVSAANGDWIEGTQNLALALAGEPCWNAKEADGSGGVLVPWAGSAGMQTATTDYDTAYIGQYTGLNAEADGTSHSAILTPSAVQAWFGLATNNGTTVRGSTNGCAFYTSDVATASYRPKLVIEYALPGGGNIFQSAILHSSLYGKTLVR
jgi:hypothetical protein